LTARFGGDRVFMDIQDIHPGQNFATSIEDTIASCDCVIALIGPAIVLLAAAVGGFVAFRPSAPSRREPPPPPAAPEIDGDWVAEMINASQQRYRIRLHFEQVGGRVSGLVRYPTGDGPIQDGELNGTTLTFSTSHLPQFESSPVTTRFVAEVTGDRIRLTATYPGGMGTGFATRAAPAESPER
jgi:hypothetical protein